MCNYGKEFVRRLELKWVDLVHLMLYNLTVYNAKKYYDLDTVIVPYANDNWNTLQLPPRVRSFNKFLKCECILKCFYFFLKIVKNRLFINTCMYFLLSDQGCQCSNTQRIYTRDIDK